MRIHVKSRLKLANELDRNLAVKKSIFIGIKKYTIFGEIQ